MNCSPPDSSVPGILQARMLEWVAIPFSRGSSWLRDWTWVSCIVGGFVTIWATREALLYNEVLFFFWTSKEAQLVKNLPANAGDARNTRLILGLGRSPEGGNGKPFPYSCLENSMDRGALACPWGAWGHKESNTTKHARTKNYSFNQFSLILLFYQWTLPSKSHTNAHKYNWGTISRGSQITWRSSTDL